MQRRNRLTGSQRFSRIHQKGTSVANRLLVVRYLANELDRNRFGFMVSKRTGNAVVRNKIKRRLREMVGRSSIKVGWDVVFIARKGIENASYQELKQAADSLLRRAKMLDNDGPASVADQPEK